MNKEIEVIEKVSKVLSGTAQNVITHYSEWFFVDAVSFIIFGLVTIFVSLYLIIKRPYDKDEFCVIYDILLLIVIFIGFCVAISHIPTLFAPEGRAINQFIKDVRG